jgi:hypothetical protein
VKCVLPRRSCSSLYPTLAAVDVDRDQIVAFLVKKKGGSIPAELGNPVVFTKDYEKHRLLSKTTYGQGTSGPVTKVHPDRLTKVRIGKRSAEDPTWAAGQPVFSLKVLRHVRRVTLRVGVSPTELTDKSAKADAPALCDFAR